MDDTNIITRMDRDTLRTNYRALVKALYEPRNYYDRVRIPAEEYKEPKEKPPLTRDALLAVLRCFFWLGLIRSGRTHFWRMFCGPRGTSASPCRTFWGWPSSATTSARFMRTCWGNLSMRHTPQPARRKRLHHGRQAEVVGEYARENRKPVRHEAETVAVE